MICSLASTTRSTPAQPDRCQPRSSPTVHCTASRLHLQRAQRPRLHRHARLRPVAAESPRKKETVFGSLVEDEQQLTKLPEPGQKDFWEGEQWEWLGKISFLALPALLLLTILIGAFAAKTYDSGATTYLKPPTSVDSTIELFQEKLSLPGLDAK